MSRVKRPNRDRLGLEGSGAGKWLSSTVVFAGRVGKPEFKSQSPHKARHRSPHLSFWCFNGEMRVRDRRIPRSSEASYSDRHCSEQSGGPVSRGEVRTDAQGCSLTCTCVPPTVTPPLSFSFCLTYTHDR